MTEKVAFGGGCFWCTEAVFLELKGVVKVISGYAGGATKNPTYDKVSMGTTGHAEVIQVEYDPAVVSFPTLLDVFFMAHDATQLNRQGNDVGTQYRSIILYTTPEQKTASEAKIAELTASGKYASPIVTEVVPLTEFYPAESYHQNYVAENPNQPYVQFVAMPKVEKLKKHHPELLK